MQHVTRQHEFVTEEGDASVTKSVTVSRARAHSVGLSQCHNVTLCDVTLPAVTHGCDSDTRRLRSGVTITRDESLDSGVIEIIVYGSPAPQGSKKFVGMSKSGRGIMVESSAKVRPWRMDVKDAAMKVRAKLGLVAPLDCPLMASMVFTLPKPSSAPKTRRTWPCRMPDASKLLRSTEDALTDAGIWADDARVVEYGRVAKVFPGEDRDALDSPGVRIRVWAMVEALQAQQQELAA